MSGWRCAWPIVTALAYVGALASLAAGQRDSSIRADWPTDGGDAARTGWQRREATLSPSSVRQMHRLWVIHLDNQPRQMHALLPPLVVGQLETPAGPKEVVFVAGSSDNLYAIDAQQGTLLWSKHFDHAFTPPFGDRGADALCPGGQTATPVVAPANSPGRYEIYAVSWDGRLHQIDAATGVETGPAARFMPANGKPYALNLWDGVLYTTTAQECGGNPNLVYAFDLATHAVQSFAPGGGGGMWGRRGPSISLAGRMFVSVGDGDFDPHRRVFSESILALATDPKTKALSLADYFTPGNTAEMSRLDLDMNATGPIFQDAGREYLVQSSKECRLWLLDTAALGGADHRTPVYTTPLVCNASASSESAGVWGALSSWEDADGTRWVLTPISGPPDAAFHTPLDHGLVAHGAVVAFKVDETGDIPHLVPAWMSRDMNRAEPPVVANGVVFGYGSGESTTQHWSDPRHLDGTAGRIAESTHAVLYALDGRTGEELWSSGSEIWSWNHFSGLAVANGRVYIGTYDGDLYCFGLDAPAGTARSAQAP